jgi:hypothetical protein
MISDPQTAGPRPPFRDQQQMGQLRCTRPDLDAVDPSTMPPEKVQHFSEMCRFIGRASAPDWHPPTAARLKRWQLHIGSDDTGNRRTADALTAIIATSMQFHDD